MRIPPRAAVALLAALSLTLFAPPAASALGISVGGIVGIDVGAEKSGVKVDVPGVTTIEVGAGGGGANVGVEVPPLDAGAQIDAWPGGIDVGAGVGGIDVGAGIGSGSGSGGGGGSGGGSSSSGGGGSSSDSPSSSRPGSVSNPDGNTAATKPGRGSTTGDSSRDGRRAGGKAGTTTTPGGASGVLVAGDPARNGADRGTVVNEHSSIFTRIVDRMPLWMKILVGLLALAAFAFGGFWLYERHGRRVAERAALVDALTGVANRKAFDQRLSEEWERSRRHGNPLGVMLVDLDGFKEVNDSRGHGVGDDVLKDVAKRLTERVRGSDVVARVGGDEFAVICPESELSGLVDLRKSLEGYEQFTDVAPVGLSIGVAELEPRDDTPQELLDRADRSMYRRKGIHKGEAGEETLADAVPLTTVT